MFHDIPAVVIPNLPSMQGGRPEERTTFSTMSFFPQNAICDLRILLDLI